MADIQYVDILTSSRYKDTTAYATSQFGPVFALMELPVEFAEARSDEVTYVVRASDIGFLDYIAVKHLGNGMEQFSWAIALLNRIIDPDREMFVGQVLRIPSRRTIAEFQSRRGNG